MVGGVRDVDGQVLGVHRTYLMRDDPGQWHRRERASLGLIGGRAVQLGYAAKMLMVAELLYSIRGAQKVLGLSRASIYRFIYGGDLATIKIGRRTAVSAASIQRLAVEGAP
jgi:predicted DNA-binding transcriptional regulator AlpA